MARTKFYHADEVAKLLNCTTSEVYALLKDGTLSGYKKRRLWLINMDQPYLNNVKPVQSEISQKTKVETKSNISYRYVRDTEHYEVLYKEIMSVKKSLEIATADFKGVRLHDRSMTEILNDLAKKGKDVTVIFMKMNSRAQSDQEEEDEIAFNHINCLRNHMKLFIFDRKKVYIGSANLTSAAIGNRTGTKKMPNFEAGLLTDDPEIVKQASDHFANVLSENICKGCKIQSCEYRHLQ